VDEGSGASKQRFLLCSLTLLTNQCNVKIYIHIYNRNSDTARALLPGDAVLPGVLASWRRGLASVRLDFFVFIFVLLGSSVFFYILGLFIRTVLPIYSFPLCKYNQGDKGQVMVIKKGTLVVSAEQRQRRLCGSRATLCCSRCLVLFQSTTCGE
jgi:hypothetical protein